VEVEAVIDRNSRAVESHPGSWKLEVGSYGRV
jgi:hypothetical protein